ncbi:UDP-2,3-diacylglucosamine diphosphatase [Thiorhodococcus fuscus]|uniref:UDP-2,3-diacylglucosamine hydrolase n=1 Tax=Thiorhodococcus fuscus TaxID=527200 RepID=A0ABW4Y8B6_9GAMM
MTHLFISDLHLSPDRPATLDLLLDFLAGPAREAERLYILGDLFDSWIGDDDDTPFNRRAIAGLRALTDAGVACDLMHGNRDFLLGRRFRRETGCRLLRDPTLISLAGEPTLLMHGDLLCTDDLAYQRFRRRVRNPLVQRLFLFKSLDSRRALAANYRNRSRAAMAEKSAEIMDVNQDTVAGYLRRFGALHLIHGHTHRPCDHEIALGDRQARRSVLAEWADTGGEVLAHRNGIWQREPITPT